jgi:hypothetical protein
MKTRTMIEQRPDGYPTIQSKYRRFTNRTKENRDRSTGLHREDMVSKMTLKEVWITAPLSLSGG